MAENESVVEDESTAGWLSRLVVLSLLGALTFGAYVWLGPDIIASLPR